MTPKLQIKHRAKTAIDFHNAQISFASLTREKRECEEGKHAKYPTLKKREILTDLEKAQHNCKGEFGRKNLPVHSLLCK